MRPDTPEEISCKERLYVGDRRTLNLYVGKNDGGVLGWSTLPQGYTGSPKRDGEHWCMCMCMCMCIYEM
ncbi:hypothetical protein EON63_07110 [archaeon]|nr:MAG: hypothetical protein EON63_07110 [archaeon]